jgi:hypothetical protein
MSEEAVSIEGVTEAVGHVLFYSSVTTDIVTRLYLSQDKRDRDRAEYELTIQEEYLVDWAKKLTDALQTSAEDVHLDLFLDRIDLFHAERRYHIWNNRGESPEGVLILDSVETKDLDELDAIFKSGTLNDAAAKLGIDRTDAAKLQILVRHRLLQPTDQ